MAEILASPPVLGLGVHIWPVGSLLHAISDSLEARFNPVLVEGEITGFSRAASGHCYFSLKDEDGQMRCAMFRRAAMLLDFSPVDGQRVQLRGRLGVYEPRGELQLVAESLQPAGQGRWFEQFLKLKAQLQAQGLFDAARKKPIPPMPRAIGVVTSLGAAALHDVLTALQRRVPHIPVMIYPASVQGANAPAELAQALRKAYACAQVDVLLLVRGGGSMEDLLAFNAPELAYVIVDSPIPIVSGIGHETDFTIADFCTDLRAPTPTAAAELCAEPQEVLLARLDAAKQRLQKGIEKKMQFYWQGLDAAASRLRQPSHWTMRQNARLDLQIQKLQHAARLALNQWMHRLMNIEKQLPQCLSAKLKQEQARLENLQVRLQALDPQAVLNRGYALLTDAQGKTVTRAQHLKTGQSLRATLSDGGVDLTVAPPRLI